MKPNVYYAMILFVTVLLVVCICAHLFRAYNKGEHFAEFVEHHQKHPIIVTCTSNFKTKEDFDQCINFICDTLGVHDKEQNDLIGHIVIVNEYNPQITPPFIKYIHEQCAIKLTDPYNIKYTLIIKKEKDIGIARSLNIILEIIDQHPYQYWLYLNDQQIGKCQNPFLLRVMQHMNTNSFIHQMDLTNEFDLTVLDNTRKTQLPGYTLIKAHPEFYSKFQCQDAIDMESTWIPYWPLFTLYPSVNRVSFLRNTGLLREGFKTNNNYIMDNKFVWEFASRWLSNGGVKSILRDPPYPVQIIPENFNSNINQNAAQS